MPELKRNFAQALMNKDLDERLVPPGQYRDANNIEISTSEGSNVGTVQTIKGNTKRNTVANLGTYSIPDIATCVGSIAALNTDKIYYFVSAGIDLFQTAQIKKDYIMEYDPVLETHKYVFVDIYEVKTSCTFTSTEASPSGSFLYIPLPNVSLEDGVEYLRSTGVRVGMKMTSDSGYGLGDNVRVTDIVYAQTYDQGVLVNRWKIVLNKALTDFVIPQNGVVKFYADNRVLNFRKDKFITGINILDDSIFWTDNESEPKRISISRSIAGTGGLEYLNNGGWAGFASAGSDTTATFKGDTDEFHTRLVKGEGTNLSVVTKSNNQKAVWVEEKHVTVIKEGPTQPLELTLHKSAAPRYDASDQLTPVSTWGYVPSLDLFPSDLNGSLSPSGSNVTLVFSEVKHFRIGDVLLLKRDLPGASFTGVGSYDLRVEVLHNIDNTGPNEDTGAQDTFSTKILSISSDITVNETSFKAALEHGSSLTELVFPRFSYRYKYQDGEYSTFAPWSEVAFLAGEFNFSSIDGFNFGMDNHLKNLEIKGYHAGEHRMREDVVAIDILYKETNNPTVYIVKTITPLDTSSWPSPTDVDENHASRGKITLTSNLIHTVVPSNQLLRPWDNVPREAKAQEISANRLIYGNYLQSYTVDDKPKIISGYEATPLKNGTSPSVKSIRDYTVGVVFSDKYGRETPVISPSDNPIKILKESSSTRNRLHARIDTSFIAPDWAKYFTYYTKETSNEYYTLVMDRWYSDVDDNVWLSLPSSERNKLDTETFIILKKAGGSDQPVLGSSKYKILDIKNEAPDYIKAVRKNVGFVYDTNGDQIGNSGEGYPIEDTTYFTIQQSSVETALGAGFNDNTIRNLTVRFSGEGKLSKYYEISNVSQPEASGGSSVGKYYFRLATKFGGDIGFATAYTGSFDSAIDNLRVDFYSADVEDKPEFHGRFFIKVKKDSELQQHVMGLSTNQDFVVEKSWPVAYINNNGYQGTSYPIADAPQSITYNANGYDSDNRHIHPTEWDYHGDQGGDEVTVYKWGNNGTNTSVGLNAVIMRDDPIAALNDEHQTSHARKFWSAFTIRQQFFIDAATAYSWASTNNNDDDGSGNSFETTPYIWPDWLSYYTSGDYEDYYNSIYGNPDFSVWAPAFGGTSGVAANMKASNAKPSRGIRDTVAADGSPASVMDISWSGIGYEDVDQYDMVDAGIMHQLKNSTLDAHRRAWEFMQRLVEPGTRFRFQDDPDETIYTVRDYTYTPEGYDNTTIWKTGSSKYSGAFGIRNYRPDEGDDFNSPLHQFQPPCMRQRWSIIITPKIGSGLNGYNPISGTKPASIGVAEDQNGPAYADSSYRRALHHDGTNNDVIEIIQPFDEYSGGFVVDPAIFETQPKENVELDIYYQASGLIPFELDDKTNEEYLPLGTTFETQYYVDEQSITQLHTITEWIDKETIKFTPALSAGNITGAPAFSLDAGYEILFTKRNNYSLTALNIDTISAVWAPIAPGLGLPSVWTWSVNDIEVDEAPDTIRLHGADGSPNYGKLSSQTQYLDWNNCWVFGNGVESDRIRDDYNAAHMDNGVKASSTITTQIKEERRKHGLIWSGIYNSTSGINDTNQFIMAEKITKDLNPIYGSIQKLYNRDTRLVMFCEDKILRGVTNKDALYNADGNPQLVASNKVIGDVTPYQGDFGISTNPESFVATPYQMYFTDAVRGQVLRMTNEGIVSISDKGMKNYFADRMASNVWKTLGTYDERKNEYNLSILKKSSPTQSGYNDDTVTVSYGELSKGWTSFKSFIPQNGLSINNKYFTFYNGHIWEHYTNDLYNRFYETPYTSDVTVILNDKPGSVKSFGAINYEGSQAKVTNFDSESAQMFNNNYASTSGGASLGLSAAANVTDGEYFNLADKTGWYVDNITTDQQACGNIEFKDKEGKWFGYPSGETAIFSNEDSTNNNLDEKEFTVQGLGTASISHSDPLLGEQIVITIADNISPTYGNAPDGDAIWDAPIQPD